MHDAQFQVHTHSQHDSRLPPSKAASRTAGYPIISTKMIKIALLTSTTFLSSARKKPYTTLALTTQHIIMILARETPQRGNCSLHHHQQVVSSMHYAIACVNSMRTTASLVHKMTVKKVQQLDGLKKGFLFDVFIIADNKVPVHYWVSGIMKEYRCMGNDISRFMRYIIIMQYCV